MKKDPKKNLKKCCKDGEKTAAEIQSAIEKLDELIEKAQHVKVTPEEAAKERARFALGELAKQAQELDMGY